MKFALLEPLRGLAAIWVLLFHFEFSQAFQQACPALHSVCKLGEMAVPMFFVISGYCIAASARSAIRKHESAGSFLKRRLRRIFPPYWASILVVAALPFVTEGISALKSGHYQMPSAENVNYGYLKYDLAEWAEVLTLTRAFVDVPGAEKLHFKFTTINAVYWSLAIEVQFYFLAALAVRFGRHFYRVMAGLTALSVPFVFSHQANAWGLFLPFWPMFALGIGLYAAFEHGWAPSRVCPQAAKFLGWGSLAVLIGAIGLIATQHWPISQTAFSVIFAATLFGIEGLDATFRKRLDSSNWFPRRLFEFSVFLGTMSYSIYLLHGRLQLLAMQFVRQAIPTGTILFDALSLGATIALCYPFFRYCEKPFIASPASASVPTAQPSVRPEPVGV